MLRDEILVLVEAHRLLRMLPPQPVQSSSGVLWTVLPRAAITAMKSRNENMFGLDYLSV